MNIRSVAWLALVVAACTTTAPPTDPSSSPSTPTTSPPTTSPITGAPPASKSAEPSPASGDTSCKEDGDCVLVQTTCCDVCNGGKQAAFNQATADKVRAETRGRLDCANTMCTMRACLNPPRAICRAGTCAASP